MSDKTTIVLNEHHLDIIKGCMKEFHLVQVVDEYGNIISRRYDDPLYTSASPYLYPRFKACLQAIEHMTDRYAFLFMLCVVGGYSSAKLSRENGVGKNYVRNAVNVATAEFMKLYEQYYEV